MKKNRIAILSFCFTIGVLSLFAQTKTPIVEIMNKSAHISSGGAVPGWDAGFRQKFNSDFQYMANQLDSDMAIVKMEGETGGKTNFEIQISITFMYDCKPCKGENAVSEESFFASFTIIDASTRKVIDKFFTDKSHWIINGEPNVQEMVDRTWSQFLLTFMKAEQLRDIIKQATNINDASLTFKPKNSSDKLPMKADGTKRGIVKIEVIQTTDAKQPVGENPGNQLTEFELSCENGNLIDKAGMETKKVKFSGFEYVANPGNFEFEYVVYNCDEHCEKYDNFILKLKSQNGVNLVREIKRHKEEFECYGYTLSLDYTETNDLTGTTNITATWECFNINFGKPGAEIAEMDMNALAAGEAFDANGNPLLPPYTIPIATESGLIHVSSPKRNNEPVSSSFSSTGGPWAEIAGSFKIDFRDDYLTNPPELIWVKTNVRAEELCGGTIPAGVYLEWQFDIWGNLPELGYSQLYQPAASMCPLLNNVANSTTASVPEYVIPLMKEGKAFTFTNNNKFGTYIITGIPQQQ